MTQLLCAANQIIPSLFSQNEMKVKVYNPGNLNHKRIDERFDGGEQHCIHYSAANKLKIVATVDRMMAEEYIKQNQACAILQVCDS
jgi:hypothetical protein